MYLITGSARTMTSPSSSITIRSTPCVEGCCGPMLRIISSVRRPRGETTSMSMPPPRTIQCSPAAVKARSWVSTGAILPTAAKGRRAGGQRIP
jgi:hypothetical protein